MDERSCSSYGVGQEAKFYHFLIWIPLDPKIGQLTQIAQHRSDFCDMKMESSAGSVAANADNTCKVIISNVIFACR